MIGCKSGVMTRLKSEVPQIKDDSSCHLHHFSNTAQHSVNAFDPDIKQVLVDTYFDLGGAPGKGLKKQKDFIKVCKEKCGFDLNQNLCWNLLAPDGCLFPIVSPLFSTIGSVLSSIINL